MTATPKSNHISPSRWAAYAVAGTASVLAGTSTAEADITYVPADVVVSDPTFDGNGVSASIALDGAAKLLFHHTFSSSSSSSVSGGARVTAMGGVTNSIVGTSSSGIVRASNLPYGQPISALTDLYPQNTDLALNGTASSYQFESGTGYLAFHFDIGDGQQLGWAQIETLDSLDDSFNDIRIIDYAYADVGDTLFVGQRSSSIPEPGSLGVLALGGLGILAWRRRRMAA